MATVAELFSQAAAEAAQIAADADEAAAKLESFADSRQTWVDFAPRSDIVLTRVSGIAQADIPQLGTLPSTDLTHQLDGLNPERFKSHVFESSFFDSLSLKIREFIDNGGTGISAEVQAAIFNRQRERKSQILNDSLDAVMAGSAGRKFLLPGSMVYAARNEIIMKHDDDSQDLSREAVVILAERAQQNVQWAMQNGIEIEKIHADFALGFSKLYIDITQAYIQNFRLIVDARVAEFRGQLDGVIARIQAEETNARLDLGYSELTMKKWEIDARESSDRTRSLIQQAEAATQRKLAAVSSLAQFYSNAVSAVAGKVNAISLQDEE